MQAWRGRCEGGRISKPFLRQTLQGLLKVDDGRQHIKDTAPEALTSLKLTSLNIKTTLHLI